jgi:hypothetical protein
MPDRNTIILGDSVVDQRIWAILQILLAQKALKDQGLAQTEKPVWRSEHTAASDRMEHVLFVENSAGDVALANTCINHARELKKLAFKILVRTE